MLHKKITFIGAGNMASAIIKGIVDKNVMAAGDIYIADIDDDSDLDTFYLHINY